jgi:hypothetical protein
MKTITLEEAFRLLQDKTDAIILGDGTLLYPALANLTGEDENQFMYLSWQDEMGGDYALKFCEGDNRAVTVVGSSMFLYDTDAEEDADHTQINLLRTVQLEEILVKGARKSVKMSDEYKKWLTEDEIKPGQVWKACDGSGHKVQVIACENNSVEYFWKENNRTKKHSKSVFSFQVRYYLE